MRPERDATFTAGRRRLRRRRRVVFTAAIGLVVAAGAAAAHTELVELPEVELSVVELPEVDLSMLAGALTTVEQRTGVTLTAAPVAGARMVATAERAPVAELPPAPAAVGASPGPAADDVSLVRPMRPQPVDPPPQPGRPVSSEVSGGANTSVLIGSADVEADGDVDGGVVRVAAVQQRLRDERFLIGPVDGRMGQQTLAAVMAFQQAVGLTVDGVVGPETRAALEAGAPEPELRGGAATRVEVDLDAQVLHVVEDDVRLATLKVSSGDGGTYRSISGGTARSRTPVGEFTIQRRIRGVRVSRLGTLYDPLYFYGGFAIHGSPSVPPGPASHGCIRVTRADGRWLFDQVPNGTPVIIHGGTHVFSPKG